MQLFAKTTILPSAAAALIFDSADLLDPRSHVDPSTVVSSANKNFTSFNSPTVPRKLKPHKIPIGRRDKVVLYVIIFYI